MSRISRAVVTGGAGFIGSHLAEALLQSHAEILVLDNLYSGNQANVDLFKGRRGYQFLECDIRSPEALAAVVDFAPHALFNLAAQMNVRLSVRDPQFDASNNVLGMVNMLEAFRIARGKAFVFSSTGGAIYGEQDYFPADEQHPIHAECPYGVGKRAGELYLEYYSRAHDFSATALRFANVYGPRQNPKGEAGVVAIFAGQLLRGETLRVNGTGEQTRDFVHVDDVVRACMLVAEEARPGFDIFNVGTARETNLLELVREMTAAWSEIRTESDPAVSRVEHGPALPGEQLRSCVAVSKIQDAFGWTPETELRAGLRGTISSFRAT